MYVGQLLICWQVSRNREGVHWERARHGKTIKDQKYYMKTTNSGCSGHLSLFLTLDFTLAFCMLEHTSPPLAAVYCTKYCIHCLHWQQKLSADRLPPLNPKKKHSSADELRGSRLNVRRGQRAGALWSNINGFVKSVELTASFLMSWLGIVNRFS